MKNSREKSTRHVSLSMFPTSVMLFVILWCLFPFSGYWLSFTASASSVTTVWFVRGLWYWWLCSS